MFLKKNRERERERERESAQSNKFDQGFHASSKDSCLSFLSAICLLVSYKDFMEDINPFRRILLFEHLIL